MSAKIVCICGEDIRGMKIDENIDDRTGIEFLGYKWINWDFEYKTPNNAHHLWARVVPDTDAMKMSLHDALQSLCFQSSDDELVKELNDYLFYGKGLNDYKVSITNVYIKNVLWSVFRIDIPNQDGFNCLIICDVISHSMSWNVHVGYMMDDGDVFLVCK